MANPNSIDKFITTAFNAGMPRDQLEGFLKYKYVPLPWQCRFHATSRQLDKRGEAVDLGVGGARGPGKSHGVFAQISLDDCQRAKGIKGLFLRQTGKAAKESFEDLIDSVVRGRIKYIYNSSTGVLKFENGSRVILGGFENEKDIDKYIGIQYDVMAVEELNQFTENKFLKLKGSLRTSKENWRPRFYASFNPGGIGHGFIKEKFVTPYQKKEEIKTKFIPSTYKENPYLNEEYIEYLESLTGTLGKAWREGNWDIFEGQYFIEWNYDKHTCEPFTIPDTWKRFRAYDYGRARPAACLWCALGFDGEVYVYREFYQTGLNADEQAKEIIRLSGSEQYEYSVADAAIFSPTGIIDKGGGETIAEVFVRNGIMFVPTSKRRVDGWNMVHQYLRWTEEQEPKIKFFNTCHNSIATIPVLSHDEIRPEDIDTDGNDDCADALRYFLMSLHEGKTKPPLTELEKKLKPHTKFNFNDFYFNK